ncbi:MAG: hypothetical protein FJ265_13770 [Planctomycetes bacterium]|nr:hypothetical protein [Planctomycetota bacterium]
MDHATFGEHQWEHPGISGCTRRLPGLPGGGRRITASGHVRCAATRHRAGAGAPGDSSPCEPPHAAFATTTTALDHLRAQVRRAGENHGK